MFGTSAFVYLALVILFMTATERLVMFKWKYDPAPTQIKILVGIFWPLVLVLFLAAMAFDRVDEIDN